MARWPYRVPHLFSRKRGNAGLFLYNLSNILHPVKQNEKNPSCGFFGVIEQRGF
jgi:hypothetical protein